MPHVSNSRASTVSNLDRERLIDWYTRNRARSQTIFDLVSPDAYYSRPIALRHPVVFYEGHLPAFSFNTLVKRGLGGPSIDARLEALFARGIDPHESSAPARTGDEAVRWPSRETVQQFAAEADRRVLRALRDGDIERPGDPLLDRAEAAFCILEHESMHQETLLYMWHRLPFEQKRRPRDYAPRVEGPPAQQEWVTIPGGAVRLGANRIDEPFTWDNERDAHTVEVPAFRMQRHDVSNAEFMRFVDAGGYDEQRWWGTGDWAWLRQEQLRHPLFWERADGRWWWRGMFERVPLPESWPVYVSQAEAAVIAGATPKAIESRLYRARQSLRLTLQRWL